MPCHRMRRRCSRDVARRVTRMMIHCPHNFVLTQEIIEFGLIACTTGDVSQTIKCRYIIDNFLPPIEKNCRVPWVQEYVQKRVRNALLHCTSRMRAGYKIVFLCSFRGQAHADAHEKLPHRGRGGLPTPLQKFTHQRTVKKSTCSCTSTSGQCAATAFHNFPHDSFRVDFAQQQYSSPGTTHVLRTGYACDGAHKTDAGCAGYQSTNLGVIDPVHFSDLQVPESKTEKIRSRPKMEAATKHPNKAP